MKAETPSLKRCPRCTESKLVDQFAKRAAAKDGLQGYCRPCNSQARQDWVNASADNKRKYKKAISRWVRSNPDRVAALLDRRRERLASAPGGPFVLERYAGRIELFGGMCSYGCGQPATTLDHAIPVSRGGGHWPSNIRPACKSHNSTKRTRKLLTEWWPKCTNDSLPFSSKFSVWVLSLRSAGLSGA